MGKEHAQQINLVAHPGAGREVAHVAVRLGLTEDPFLSTAPFAKLQHLTSRQALVREDDLEVVAVLVRDEEIELHRLLVLAAHFGADEQQAPAVVLAFRFPEEFEVGHFITQPVPTLAGLGSLLELDQACEGHAHGVLNPRRLELAQDGVAIRWLRSVALGALSLLCGAVQSAAPARISLFELAALLADCRPLVTASADLPSVVQRAFSPPSPEAEAVSAR